MRNLPSDFFLDEWICAAHLHREGVKRRCLLKNTSYMISANTVTVRLRTETHPKTHREILENRQWGKTRRQSRQTFPQVCSLSCKIWPAGRGAPLRVRARGGAGGGARGGVGGEQGGIHQGRPIEERQNDPARPQKLILYGEWLARLGDNDPARRALLQDDRLRRLPSPPPTTTTVTTTTNETIPHNHDGDSSRETFVYDTTLGEALRFGGGSVEAMPRAIERSNDAALKQAEVAKLAKPPRSASRTLRF
jgi:hypothetical protein